MYIYVCQEDKIGISLPRAFPSYLKAPEHGPVEELGYRRGFTSHLGDNNPEESKNGDRPREFSCVSTFCPDNRKSGI